MKLYVTFKNFSICVPPPAIDTMAKNKSTNANNTKGAAAAKPAIAKKQAARMDAKEKAAGSEQRSKDIRLNRALEELERTKAQLAQLKDDRENAGQGARSGPAANC